MGRRTVLLIVAVLIAAAGTALILMYVQGINARAVEGQERVEVLAATDQIDAGEKFADAQAAGKIDTVEIARDDMVDGALASADSITDEVAVSTIYPDEQILAQKFGKPEDAQTLPIPDGMIAVSVELTDPARVAGFVNPGSRVALFVSVDPELIKEDGSTQPLPAYTDLLLPDVQVVGVGDTTVHTTTKTDEQGQQTTEEIPRTILTLAVTTEEAKKVVFSARNGELALGLRTTKSKVDEGPGARPGTVVPDAFSGTQMQSGVGTGG
jgi:pilus assembly protein CpaB